MLGCWWWGGGGLWGRLWWRRFAVMGIISLPINLPGTPFNKAIKASNLVRKNLLEIVKKRQIDLAEGKASPVQDMLSHMLATSDHELTKDYEIADKILGLLLGGHGSGSVIEITKLPGYVLETKVKGEVMSTVESELLCRAYFNMYLGDDPFDKEAKENFGASLLALF